MAELRNRDHGVFFVTAALGGGKSLGSVVGIQEYLNRGKPVATNLNLYLENLMPGKKNTRVYRIPDKPTAADLEMLDSSHATGDEKDNGLIVFDECGTWFNSRSWNDKERQKIIEWLLHARKRGWDMYFIVQHISVVDKQAREMFAEFIVYMKRVDKMSIPFVSSAFKALTGSKMPLPKAHVGTVKMGKVDNSPVVDTWRFRGKGLYTSYETKQIFKQDILMVNGSPVVMDATYCLLPSWYTKERYQVKRDWRFLMRMTKIYWKRFNRPLIAVFGVMLGVTLNFGSSYFEKESQQYEMWLADQKEKGLYDVALDEAKQFQFKQEFNQHYITGFAKYPGDRYSYSIKDKDHKTISEHGMKAKGYQLRVIEFCQVEVSKDGYSTVIYCS